MSSMKNPNRNSENIQSSNGREALSLKNRNQTTTQNVEFPPISNMNARG